MFGRPSFGVSQPSTFGFGSGTSTSFGQPNQLFGSSGSTFGSGSSGFGTASQPIFGNPQQSTAPLFGSASTPAFGQSTQPSGFGTSLFGGSHTTQQPSGGGIFGSSSNTSFGQQSKPAGFGFPSSSASGGLFGQNTQTSQQNATPMFQSSATSSLFGSPNTFGATQTQSGTVTKFVPVTGTDSVQKAGVVQSINTKHHCITCMKEYENKSLEELRCEDYQANRKVSLPGPQQQPSFGAPSQPFGIASTNSSLFGQTENKPVFGQSSTAFGQPSFGISSQTTASNMFGKSSTGFGNTSTTNSFAFGTGTPSTGLFGSSTASKPFAAPTNQPLFGSTQPQQTNFGSNIFGQPSTQSSTTNLFAKPTQQQGFNMGQSTYQFGAQPQNPTNVFQSTKPNNTGFNIFGQPNTTTAFGQPQQQSTFPVFNNFAKPSQPMFGQTTQPTFSSGIQSSSIFGNNTSKSLFQPSTNLFSTTFQPTTGFNMPTQQPQQQPLLNLQTSIETLPQDSRSFLQTVDPYGYSPHLAGLVPLKSFTPAYSTSPRELQKYLEAPQPIAVVTPITKRMKVLKPAVKKVDLFDDGMDEKRETNFSLRQSAKRLVIKKNNNQTIDENDSHIHVEVDGQPNSEPTPLSITAKGPPLFVQPLRFRKPIALDEYSSSDQISTDISMSQFDKDSKSESTQCSSTNLLVSNRTIDDDEISTDKVNNSNDAPIDTCGVISTRAEYYTVPPFEKLIEHKQGDGQCLIKGFTIGRIGYGNVSFPDLMDVANLNLDELVHFRYRELTIYPDDSKKPPLGQGLNRRAQVTLDRVFPKGKADRKLITDVGTLISINFAETLRDLCDKHGTKFLDYRPETGSWVFMVEHFSKYGFSDPDEEEAAINLTIPTQQKYNRERMEIKVDEEIRTEKERQILEKEDEEKTEESLEPIEEILIDDDDIMIEIDTNMQSDSAISDTADSVEIENTDDDLLTTTTSSESLHQVKTRKDLYRTDGDKMLLMKATLFEDDEFVPMNIESDNIETISKSQISLKEFIKPLPLKRKVDKSESQKPRVFLLNNKSCAIPMSKSLYNCRNYMDIAIFKSRSFKVGWSKGLILVTPRNSFDHTQGIQNNKSRLEVIDVSNLTNHDPLSKSLSGHLQILLETSEVKLIEGIPYFKIDQIKSGLLRHKNLAREIYLKDMINRETAYYKELWDLIVALWGDIPSNQIRREHLSKWFQSVLAKDVRENLKQYSTTNEDHVFEKIFTYLTGYQLSEAAEMAVKNNLPNLSLLISQTNLSVLAKPMLQKQIEQWKTSMSLDDIDWSLQKIYMLLSGLLVNDNETNKFIDLVNICENLNWRQCIAIILWFVTSSAQPISTTIDLYTWAFDKNRIAQKPLPEHLDNGSNIFDIQYHLMLLYCNENTLLEQVLNPLTHTSYAGDYRLSWILLQTLTALNVGKINENARNTITTSFSNQLESMGLPKWAVFVLLFIKDPSIRKNLVMNSLHRNLTTNPSDVMENELVKDLCIPPQWIHEVKSYKTQLLHMHWQSYRHLSYTKLWYESHKIAIESIIPDLIINEKFNIVRSILENLEQGQMRMSNWKTQGGLLLDFLKFVHIFNESNLEINKDDALSVHSALLDICTRLQFYPTSTPKQIAAVSELSKRCYIYAKLLLNYISPIHEGLIAVTNLEVDRLVMPADYAFEDVPNEDLRMQIE